MGVHKSQEIVHLILGSFYIVVLALIPSSDHFELNSALFVIGYVGQDVILPCQSSSGALPQNVEVQWKKTVDDNTENIYQFTAFTGQETFGQGYESRAVFATEGLDTGNVSLMLKMAKKADEGSYSCIVKTKDWGAQTQTVLVVESSKGNSTSENSCSFTAFWVTLVFLLLALLALLALAVTVWTFKHKDHCPTFQGAREKGTFSRNGEQSVKEEKEEIKEEEGLLQEIRTFQKEKEFSEACSFKVDVVFDPELAVSQLEVSRDWESVSDTESISKIFYYSDTLTLHAFIVAAHCFSEGKYYWEVEVGQKENWDLGVASHSVHRKGKAKLRPENGYWVIGLDGGKDYWAWTEPRTHLEVTGNLTNIGMFLNEEKGSRTLSFYDVHTRSKLHTFRISCSHKLYPVLSMGPITAEIDRWKNIPLFEDKQIVQKDESALVPSRSWMKGFAYTSHR